MATNQGEPANVSTPQVAPVDGETMATVAVEPVVAIAGDPPGFTVTHLPNPFHFLFRTPATIEAGGPMTVLVTGASGQIAYSLLYMIATGNVFGPDQPITLHLFDILPMREVVYGVALELSDCGLPLLRDIFVTTDPAVAFTGVSAVFLIGATLRRGKERADLLRADAPIFRRYGEALESHAPLTALVVVIGDLANTNAMICAHHAPSFPRANFTASMLLCQNRARAILSAELGVPTASVRNVIVWGNCSGTQFPDAQQARVVLGTEQQTVYDVINNDMEYLQGEFVKRTQKREAAVRAAHRMTAAMSTARAASEHMRVWWSGTADGEIVSMGVVSDGSYGIAAEEVVCSFPVRIGGDKKWTIVQELSVDDFVRGKLEATVAELLEETELGMDVATGRKLPMFGPTEEGREPVMKPAPMIRSRHYRSSPFPVQLEGHRIPPLYQSTPRPVHLSHHYRSATPHPFAAKEEKPQGFVDYFTQHMLSESLPITPPVGGPTEVDAQPIEGVQLAEPTIDTHAQAPTEAIAVDKPTEVTPVAAPEINAPIEPPTDDSPKQQELSGKDFASIWLGDDMEVQPIRRFRRKQDTHLKAETKQIVIEKMVKMLIDEPVVTYQNVTLPGKMVERDARQPPRHSIAKITYKLSDAERKRIEDAEKKEKEKEVKKVTKNAPWWSAAADDDEPKKKKGAEVKAPPPSKMAEFFDLYPVEEHLDTKTKQPQQTNRRNASPKMDTVMKAQPRQKTNMSDFFNFQENEKQPDTRQKTMETVQEVEPHRPIETRAKPKPQSNMSDLFNFQQSEQQPDTRPKPLETVQEVEPHRPIETRVKPKQQSNMSDLFNFQQSEHQPDTRQKPLETVEEVQPQKPIETRAKPKPQSNMSDLFNFQQSEQQPDTRQKPLETMQEVQPQRPIETRAKPKQQSNMSDLFNFQQSENQPDTRQKPLETMQEVQPQRPIETRAKPKQQSNMSDLFNFQQSENQPDTRQKPLETVKEAQPQRPIETRAKPKQQSNMSDLFNFQPSERQPDTRQKTMETVHEVQQQRPIETRAKPKQQSNMSDLFNFQTNEEQPSRRPKPIERVEEVQKVKQTEKVIVTKQASSNMPWMDAEPDEQPTRNRRNASPKKVITELKAQTRPKTLNMSDVFNFQEIEKQPDVKQSPVEEFPSEEPIMTGSPVRETSRNRSSVGSPLNRSQGFVEYFTEHMDDKNEIPVEEPIDIETMEEEQEGEEPSGQEERQLMEPILEESSMVKPQTVQVSTEETIIETSPNSKSVKHTRTVRTESNSIFWMDEPTSKPQPNAPSQQKQMAQLEKQQQNLPEESQRRMRGESRPRNYFF